MHSGPGPTKPANHLLEEQPLLLALMPTWTTERLVLVLRMRGGKQRADVVHGSDASIKKTPSPQ